MEASHEANLLRAEGHLRTVQALLTVLRKAPDADGPLLDAVSRLTAAVALLAAVLSDVADRAALGPDTWTPEKAAEWEALHP
jgi:hypothetical protein